LATKHGIKLEFKPGIGTLSLKKKKSERAWRTEARDPTF